MIIRSMVAASVRDASCMAGRAAVAKKLRPAMVHLRPNRVLRSLVPSLIKRRMNALSLPR
jgi:hypothetical protein